MSPLPNRRKPPERDHAPERARAALLGLAVGDALGATNEFRRLNADPFPRLMDGPHTEIVGGGPHQVKAGQVTDDTHMACCLAQSLRELRRLDEEDIARKYRAWAEVAFDIGNQTRAVLTRRTEESLPHLAGKRHWVENSRRPAGNGSLMRTAPIGVFFAKDRAALIDASLRESAITHFDPRCQLACAVFNGTLAAAITGPGSLKKEQLLAETRTVLTVAADELAQRHPDVIREVQDASTALQEDLSFALKDDPELYGPELHMLLKEGFVRVAFRLAYWELFHAPSFEAALIDVANRGGDSDTNAAICGALLGAVYGEGAIPGRWRDTVLDALSSSRGPFAERYHPRQLLTLVGVDPEESDGGGGAPPPGPGTGIRV